MKKLILLAVLFVALAYQPSKAQVSFGLSITSGPQYAPVYYNEPVYHQPVTYYAPARRVYVERRRPTYYRTRVVSRPVYHRTYYRSAPRTRYVSSYRNVSYKSHGNGHYKFHGNGHGHGKRH